MKKTLIIALSFLLIYPTLIVLASESGVLFRRIVNGKLGWHATGNENSDEKYLGEILNSLPNGRGTLIHPSGGTYEGEFKDGLPNGHGNLSLPSGKKYVGQWKEGIQEGQGFCTFSDGSTYVGELKNGIADGQGTYTLPNGNKYEGAWKKGKKEGQGTYTFSDGRTMKGEFRNDKYWNSTMYDLKGNILENWLAGKEVIDQQNKSSLILRFWNGGLGRQGDN
ncbi:MAG: molecular chaperone Tir [SAR324 cluster bacterium]|nr:molecular chaperone Tir [SAR324 cluster bacterium]MBL7035856.1 molecular chaperone Tir [SAR324 cluster bacterium]